MTIIKGKTTWVDIQKPNKKDIEYLRKTYKFHPIILDELLQPSARARVERYDNYLFMVYHLPVYDHAQKTSRRAEIDVLITRDTLITVHYENLEPIESLSRAIHNNPHFKERVLSEDSARVLYYLIQEIINFSLRQLRHVQDKVEAIGKNLFKGQESELLERTSYVKRDILEYRIIARPQETLLESLESASRTFWGEKTRVYFNDLAGDYLKVIHALENYREAVEAFESTNAQLLNAKMNHIMSRFTVLAFLTFPLMLLVGLFDIDAIGRPIIGKSIYDFWLIVYDDPHIGNARTYLAFDAFVRYVRNRGWKVSYLQNVTDIDDKIIARAREEGVPAAKIARRYERVYLGNMRDLGISSVDRYARATDFIPEIVRQIKTLLRRRHAYLIPGDGYYFDLSTFPDYGKLARRTTLQAEDAVSRIDLSAKKRNRGDFALWKFSKTGEPSWKTELGAGRPGWHIEDTAISERFFGPQYDLHGGAADLKFPHHEAEIAQQESASGKKPFVRVWMHTGFLTVDGKKMSKSAHNFVTINDFLARFPAAILRLIVLQHHYRSPVDYSDALAHGAQKTLHNLEQLLARLALVETAGPMRPAVAHAAKNAEAKFHAALEDDFATPQALSALFAFASFIERAYPSLRKKEAALAAAILEGHFRMLGLMLAPFSVPKGVRALAVLREEMRRGKNFAAADTLRKKLESLGYRVDDTPHGPLITPWQ
ncbi:MAG: Cysteine-tRNA ligase [Parcubacteria group bacterium GW2011_GWA1_60_11]|nr:MAG: Cysteine-tRNA ligase [Parcubacteria group bacterium GW2011_GWA1_60_11]